VKINFKPPFASEGWCQAEVEIAVSGFHGKIQPWLDGAEVEHFVEQLTLMYNLLKGSAELKPLEEQLVLRLEALSNGHIRAKGVAWSDATCGNKLEFELGLDQSYLPSFIGQLQKILKK
jgi:hypothetical protein